MGGEIDHDDDLIIYWLWFVVCGLILDFGLAA